MRPVFFNRFAQRDHAVVLRHGVGFGINDEARFFRYELELIRSEIDFRYAEVDASSGVAVDIIKPSGRNLRNVAGANSGGALRGHVAVGGGEGRFGRLDIAGSERRAVLGSVKGVAHVSGAVDVVAAAWKTFSVIEDNAIDDIRRSFFNDQYAVALVVGDRRVDNVEIADGFDAEGIGAVDYRLLDLTANRTDAAVDLRVRNIELTGIRVLDRAGYFDVIEFRADFRNDIAGYGRVFSRLRHVVLREFSRDGRVALDFERTAFLIDRDADFAGRGDMARVDFNCTLTVNRGGVICGRVDSRVG